MKLIRFTEAEIMIQASVAHKYFVDRPDENRFRMFMKAERERYPVHGPVFQELTPTLEIKRPVAMVSGGLGEAIRSMAAYWDIFNQIFKESTWMTGDR